ncbi:hypothetical protein ACSBR2_033430 [Camellia fascicularis]
MAVGWVVVQPKIKLRLLLSFSSLSLASLFLSLSLKPVSRKKEKEKGKKKVLERRRFGTRGIRAAAISSSHTFLFFVFTCFSLFVTITNVPLRCADDKPFTPTYQVSKERTKSLGIEFIPLKQSIKETVESLKEKKLFTW